MKKSFLTLSVLLMTLFFGIKGANAAIVTDSSPNQCNTIYDAPVGGYNMACNMSFVVSATETTADSRTSIKTGDELEVVFELKEGKDSFHIVSNEVEITAATGWTIDGEASKVVTIKEDGSVSVTMKYTGTDTLEAGTRLFATAKYQKDDTYTSDCGFAYGTPAPSLVCKMVVSSGVTYYYDSKGELIEGDDAEAKFYQECYVCKPKSEADDGNWHGSTGGVVTEDDYYAQCMSCQTPSQSTDGKYHGLDGKVTDETTYKKECTNICRIDEKNNKYYCKEGNECTKEQYNNECAENPKSGSFIPYAGIAAGIILIATATIMVRKQSKLRKI